MTAAAVLAGLACIAPALAFCALAWALAVLVALLFALAVAEEADDREDARRRSREPIYWRPRRGRR